MNETPERARPAAPGRTPRRSTRACALLIAAALLPAPAGAGDWKVEPFRIKNKKADFELKLGGYIQYDLRAFDWQVEDPTFRSEGAGVRRVRTGLELTWRKLKAEFTLDYTDPLRDWIGDEESFFALAEFKNLFVEYEFSKAFSLRAGATKPPVSYEFLTSAGKTDFVERAMLANSLGIDRDWGVLALGELRKRFSYQIGVFAGDGRTQSQRAETTFAARLGAQVSKPFDVQVSFSRGNVEAEPDQPGTDPEPKGFQARSPSGWRFYERKFVDGARTRWGIDSQYTRGPLQVKAEFLQAREERKRQGSTFLDLPTEVGNGWSATASYVLTGEKKERTLKPGKPLTKGGAGLIELAVRYESLRIDDVSNTGFEGAGNRARNIRPAQDGVFWAGVLWVPAEWIRIYGDLISENYLDPLLAPEPPGARFVSGTPIGRGRYTTFIARLEFLFP